ncbi:hypothetical protein [Streptomyces seoulensis]|uniref:hypothetical protein n=1 Tax=Streptomyces seoulensis TaxID=73044 RepID=UPI0033AA8328
MTATQVETDKPVPTCVDEKPARHGGRRMGGALACGGGRCVVTLHTDGSVSVKDDGQELQLAEQPLLSGLIPKATF